MEHDNEILDAIDGDERVDRGAWRIYSRIDYLRDGHPRCPRLVPWRLFRLALRMRCLLGSHPYRWQWYSGHPMKKTEDTCAVCGKDGRQ